MPAIETRGVSRAFGAVRALDSFSASLPYGEVIALVGPNGAGKTTLLLILAGLLAPSSGTVRVAGMDPTIEPYEVHRNVGWMPDFFGVYDDLTPREYLGLFGAAYELSPADASRRSAELLDAVGLASKADVKLHTLSRGQKQRLGFARTLIHSPRVLLLDEPASGLDPRARIQLRDLVRRQARDGVCVLISSHILQELEEMADSVVFMDAGRFTGSYRMNELPRTLDARRYRVRAIGPNSLHEVLTSLGVPFETAPDGGAVVELDDDEGAADLIERLVGRGVRVVTFTDESTGLEGAFLSMGGVEA